MAPEEKIRARIREIAGRKNNVDEADIAWVMNQLKQFGDVSVETENVAIQRRDFQHLYAHQGWAPAEIGIRQKFPKRDDEYRVV
jgi:hypothetical protein